jgi:hypothetical protein
MAVPVINPNTSVLGYNQWQTFEYQPYATNAPEHWSCDGLPPGVSIDEDTGLINGFSTAPGVWICPLIATNLDGDSVPMLLTFGIDPAAFTPSIAPALLIDLDTGHVTSGDGARSSAQSDAGPLFWVKENDTVPLLLRFYNGGTYIDFTISSLKFGLKQFEPESLVVTGGGETIDTDFKKFGSDDSAYWVMVASFNGAALASALSDFEGDAGTYFYALAEIEWQTENPFGIGADPIIRTSRTFLIGVERDLIPND